MAALGLDHRRFGRYLDALGDLRECEVEIQDNGLADVQNDVVLYSGLKVLRFRTDGIGGRQESAQAVFAAFIGESCAGEPLSHIGSCDFCLWEGRTGWVIDRPSDIARGAHALRVRGSG